MTQENRTSFDNTSVHSYQIMKEEFVNANLLISCAVPLIEWFPNFLGSWLHCSLFFPVQSWISQNLFRFCKIQEDDGAWEEKPLGTSCNTPGNVLQQSKASQCTLWEPCTSTQLCGGTECLMHPYKPTVFFKIVSCDSEIIPIRPFHSPLYAGQVGHSTKWKGDGAVQTPLNIICLIRFELDQETC